MRVNLERSERRDPEVGGGSEGTCKVTQNQPRHVPRSYLAPRTFWTLQVDDVCKSEDCIFTTSTKFGAAAGDYRFIQRGNTGHLHPINPEIDRTYHRLVRQSRNLPFHSVPDSVSDSDSISDFIPQYTDFVHFVALSDSEYSENFVHSENMAQPPTPPGPRERTLRELAAPDFTYDSLHSLIHLKALQKIDCTIWLLDPSQVGPPGPLQSENIFLGLGNNMEKVCMSIGRDSRGYVQVAPIIRFHSNSYSNIFMKV
ncbi:hypothetical protein Lal_00033996 [Lupinus albus]|nr:hypothetical protein Lal_00033996 [Lupinus albus]